MSVVKRFTWVLVLVLSSLSLADNTQSPLGVNFWFFNDWQTIWPFVDFFKASRPFWPQPAKKTYPWGLDDIALELDANGYPVSLPDGVGAATLMFWGNGGHHPGGEYTCLYDGTGDIWFSYNATVVSKEPGRIVVNVEAKDQGTLLQICESDPNDPVRNIRFIAPGFEDTYEEQPFHPLFLARLKNFKVLRFMDWMGTNDAEIEHWEDRPRPSWQTQAQGRKGGVALEHMIQLCNAVPAEPYFTMPCGGTDDYYRKFAEMVRDSLNPDLHVYVEYANEVWNGMFRARRWCSIKGNEDLGKTDAAQMDWGSCVHWWTKRSVRLFEIFDQVLGADRVIKVMGTQAGNQGISDAVLTTNDAGQYADVLAMAPYFGAKGEASVDAAIAALKTAVANKQESFEWHKAKADEYELRLICYESGLDMFQDKNLEGVRRDPRLKDIYLDYLNLWKNSGGTMMVHYAFCDPAWGLFEYMDQDTTQAPSYMAAQEFIANNPTWWEEPAIAVRNPGSASPARHPEQTTISLVAGGTGFPVISLTAPEARDSHIAVYGLTGRRIGTVIGSRMSLRTAKAAYVATGRSGSARTRTLLRPIK